MTDGTIRRRPLELAIMIAVALGASAADGQEIAHLSHSSNDSGRTIAASGAKTSALAGVFETRWPAPGDDSIVDAKGALQRSDEVIEQRGLLMHSGSLDSTASFPAATHRLSDTDVQQAAAEAPTNSMSPIGQADAGVAPCGPSPFDPDRIGALVEEAAIRHGVDASFATAIVAVESNFDRNRNSPKGARGPMQLMPATATRFNVADICDPIANIDGGIRYLRTLFEEFGNPLLVAAAYNGGEQRIYEYGGIPPFAETVGYVAKIVNHHLGLPMPTAKRKLAGSPSAAGSGEDDQKVGVIAPKKTGSFVGGVMHF